MLKISGLHKYYQSKTGQMHHALRGIDLEFGNKGFIVLLGKSGSGKSTLLNILGGLDNFDDGEITIKDKSTIEFKSNEWDSYRNTYVGFVFQEFYIIEEYTVGKNISLALELQGYPKERIDKRVDEILAAVDLEGYADRQPNEISGGQKQRIAIARALVKDPHIILADEPTGNLDSETGKMILNTLKKLSKDKLVIMVTHDADFAREYGDRIIELKDGEVISDQINFNQNIVEEEIYDLEGQVKSVIKLPKGRQLTQTMIDYLNKILLNEENDLYLSVTDDKEYISTIVPDIDHEKSHVVHYDVTSHLNSESDDEFALKQSFLPFKHAFKLALSSLFTRKVRLIFTTILFILALVFVGFASNFSFYDVAKVSNETFKAAGLTEIPFTKVAKKSRYESYKVPIYEEELNVLRKKYKDIEFFSAIDLAYNPLNLSMISSNQVLFDKIYYTNANQFSKIILIDDNNKGYQLTHGNEPVILNELLISDYTASIMVDYKIVSNFDEIIGHTFTYKGQTMTITGIVDTNYEKYDGLKEITNPKNAEEERLFYTYQKERSFHYQSLYMTSETYHQTFEVPRRTFGMRIYHEKYDNFNYMHTGRASGNFNVTDGRKPMNENEIAIGRGFYHFIEDQDKIDPESIDLRSKLNTPVELEIELYKDNKFVTEKRTFTIVGIIDDHVVYIPENGNDDYFEPANILLNDSLYEYIEKYTVSYESPKQIAHAIFGTNSAQNTRFIKDFDKLNYEHLTIFSSELYNVKMGTEIMRTIFYVIGGVIAVFTSLMIFTFISSSIVTKQKEIGTLRAIGARGIDVSKIFITEGLIVALFSGIIANIITTIGIIVFNRFLVAEFALSIVILYVNVLSILSVFVVSIVVIVIATFIPIKRITVMKPIKAIKNTL